MHIQFYFKNINCGPECKILINEVEFYCGPVMPCIEFNYSKLGLINLSIEFINKSPTDTIVDHFGNIVKDKSFELEKIVVDGYDLEELIWDSYYLTNNNQLYRSCLFFGPPGKFIIELSSPILPWLLKTRHEKYNNDPNWEEDYNYYIQACKILEQM